MHAKAVREVPVQLSCCPVLLAAGPSAKLACSPHTARDSQPSCPTRSPVQGHALFTRAAGSTIPCPAIDFVGGFNQFLAAAYGLPEGTTIEEEFGAAFDPFMNDQNFVLCVTTLEELGATGNLGLSQIALNPVLAGGIGGLATSATAQATVERMMLWGMRNATVAPFNETVQQVFARVSALRDSLDGPQVRAASAVSAMLCCS